MLRRIFLFCAIITSIAAGQNSKLFLGPEFGLLSQASSKTGLNQSANIGYVFGGRLDYLINRHGILSEFTFRKNSTSLQTFPLASKTDITNTMFIYSQSYYLSFSLKGGYVLNPTIGIDLIYLKNQKIGKYRWEYGNGENRFADKVERDVNEFTYGVHFGIDFRIPVRNNTFNIKLFYEIVNQDIVDYSGFNFMLGYSVEVFSKNNTDHAK